MNLANLVSSFASLAAANAGEAVVRKAQSLGWYVVTCLFLLTFYVTATASFVAWLATQHALWVAFAVAAGAFLILAGIVFLIALLVDRSDERRSQEAANARRDAMLSAVGSLQGETSAQSMITAALMGLAAGALFKRS